MSDANSDADKYDYPSSWRPKGATPPTRRSYKPPLRSGLGFTGDEHTPRYDDYPESWKRPTKAT